MGWHSFQRQLMILESKPKSTKHPSKLTGETGLLSVECSQFHFALFQGPGE